MTDPTSTQDVGVRDGTSQISRIKKALLPDYVSVDERSLKDLLAFIQGYAAELKYFDENNQHHGDWQAFFPKNINPAELIAFINNPESVSGSGAALYRRPHFVLLLGFLQLLEHAKGHLNTLTQRHLDFYYQQFLKLEKKPAQPDKVNLFIEPAKKLKHYCLPAGSLLNAGKDSEGNALIYETDKDTFISQAQVAGLSSLYADIKRIGIREARELYIDKNASGESAEQEAFLEMLKIALGRPAPGDSLPKYPESQAGIIDYQLLTTLHDQVAFVGSHLCMLFSAFTKLMRFKNRRLPTEQYPQLLEKHKQDWTTINRVLEQAGKITHKNPDFEIIPADSTEFDKNLKNALGSLNFADLKEVVDPSDFETMMYTKGVIDDEWKSINTLLEQAALKKTGKSTTIEPPDSPDFEKNIEKLLGLKTDKGQEWLPGISNIDQLHQAIIRIENYFCVSALEFNHLMETVKSPTKAQWETVYSILSNAFQKSRETARQKILEDASQGDTNLEIVAALLSVILGRNITTETALEALDELTPFLSDNDFIYLVNIAKEPESAKDPESLEWQKVHRFLAVAWGLMKGTELLPEKLEWQNLYAIKDATTAIVSMGIEADQIQRWDTFGRKAANSKELSENLAEFGWAINSPMLLLSEGTRTITLELTFVEDQFDSTTIGSLLTDEKGSQLTDKDKLPFKVLASTEKGWIEPDDLSIEPDDNEKTLTFNITYHEGADSIIAPTAKRSLPGSWPTLKIVLRQLLQDTGHYITPYQVFKDLRLSGIDICVDVQGLSKFQIQNDETLDPSKPFEPFGAKPVVGSRFYMAHPELVNKEISSLTFNPEWMNLPVSIEKHYKNYFPPETGTDIPPETGTDIPPETGTDIPPETGTETIFTTLISIEDQRAGDSLIKFTDCELLKDTIDIPQGTTDKDTTGYCRDLNAKPGSTPKEWSRYIQWELQSPDFQHTAYPALAAQKATQLAIDIANEQPGSEETYRVNPPYTPTIKKMTINYQSSLSVPTDDDSSENRAEQIFHIYPFGYSELPLERDMKTHFLPQFDNEGELFIGIEKLDPPQNLSLLFQMAEGSADADFEPETVHWSYLSGNHWISLDEGNVISDTTRGLINSGIVELALKPALANTILPPDLYWIRAGISKNSNSVCDTIAIHTQAVSATLGSNNNAADHFSRPLAPDTIKKLLKPVKEIKTVHQPYTSFGGKAAEQDQWFYTRISERLRHKNRALSQWDYEHLILERFPQIYKAKCIPASLSPDNETPGHIQIIVIPDIRNRFPFDPFEPKAPADLIAEIKHFLRNKAPASASISVNNAVYIPVKVRMGIRFHSGYNQGYYKKKLNEELNRFLSPWAYEKGSDIVIGGKIYANSIINFVDERPYVDYVTNIKLFKGSNFESVNANTSGVYCVEPDHPGEVLVSAREHHFDLIAESGYEEESFTGINYMIIELDFQVA